MPRPQRTEATGETREQYEDGQRKATRQRNDRPCLWCGGPCPPNSRGDIKYCKLNCRQTAYHDRKRRESLFREALMTGMGNLKQILGLLDRASKESYSEQDREEADKLHKDVRYLFEDLMKDMAYLRNMSAERSPYFNQKKF